MSDIDISKCDKAAVLATLYNRAKPQGLGYLQYTPKDMTIDEARELLNNTSYFDYVHGRVMKINLKGNVLRTGLFDRDNGEGSAEAALREAQLI